MNELSTPDPKATTTSNHAGFPEGENHDARRVRGFARYFKDYMGVWSIVVAALPVPVTAIRLIPMYKQYRGPLSVYTPLFCFLLLGFVFFVRHQLAPLMFRRRGGKIGVGQFSLVPLLLILVSFVCIVFYHLELQQSVASLQQSASGVGSAKDTAQVLDGTDLRDIPLGSVLISLYLAFFLSAEGAFVLMATKEYLQDEIGISDRDLYSFILAPESSICEVTIDADVGSASVLIDQKYIGVVPCKALLDPGEHVLQVEHFRYKPWSQSITVRPTDRSLHYNVSLLSLSY